MCLPSHCPCHWGLQVLCTELHAYNVPKFELLVHAPTSRRCTAPAPNPHGICRGLCCCGGCQSRMLQILKFAWSCIGATNPSRKRMLSFSVSVGKLCCASQADQKLRQVTWKTCTWRTGCPQSSRAAASGAGASTVLHESSTPRRGQSLASNIVTPSHSPEMSAKKRRLLGECHLGWTE